jgi:hypothetical protein
MTIEVYRRVQLGSVGGSAYDFESRPSLAGSGFVAQEKRDYATGKVWQ